METDTRAGVELTRLFAPDVLLPVQVLQPPADRWLQRLYLAVLEEALKCLGVGGSHQGPVARARNQREAWDWVMADAEYCFSFTTVCAVLQLNVEAVRKQLTHRFAPGRAPQGGFPRSLRPLCARTPRGGVAQRRRQR